MKTSISNPSQVWIPGGNWLEIFHCHHIFNFKSKLTWILWLVWILRCTILADRSHTVALSTLITARRYITPSATLLLLLVASLPSSFMLLRAGSNGYPAFLWWCRSLGFGIALVTSTSVSTTTTTAPTLMIW